MYFDYTGKRRQVSSDRPSQSVELLRSNSRESNRQSSRAHAVAMHQSRTVLVRRLLARGMETRVSEFSLPNVAAGPNPFSLASLSDDIEFVVLFFSGTLLYELS